MNILLALSLFVAPAAMAGIVLLSVVVARLRLAALGGALERMAALALRTRGPTL